MVFDWVKIFPKNKNIGNKRWQIKNRFILKRGDSYSYTIYRTKNDYERLLRNNTLFNLICFLFKNKYIYIINL